MGIAFSYPSAKQTQQCSPRSLFPPAFWLLPVPSLLDPLPLLITPLSPSSPQCTTMNMVSTMPVMDPFSAKRRAVITTIPLENTVLTFPTVVSKLLPTVLAPMAMSLMFHTKEPPSTLNTNPLPTPLLPTNPTLLPSTSPLPNPTPLPTTPLPSTTQPLLPTNPAPNIPSR